MLEPETLFASFAPTRNLNPQILAKSLNLCHNSAFCGSPCRLNDSRACGNNSVLVLLLLISAFVFALWAIKFVSDEHNIISDSNARHKII